MDGLVEDVFWHEGRSPAYGEGITFWALGEMVRKRAGLAEGDDHVTTRARIAETLLEYVPDATERRWIEPKLLGLLGIEEVGTLEREELFGAWRAFFEHVSDLGTTVLVFEDLQWADQGLIDFVDHLAEWSVSHPIMIVALARSEFLEQQRSWGAGRRHFVAMTLTRCPMTRWATSWPAWCRVCPHRPIERSWDVPKGFPCTPSRRCASSLWTGAWSWWRAAIGPIGDLADLEVPTTLQALIAARLDSLDPSLRSLLQDAAVLGQTFSVASLASIAGSPEPQLVRAPARPRAPGCPDAQPRSSLARAGPVRVRPGADQGGGVRHLVAP